jgi:hypothetical protein
MKVERRAPGPAYANLQWGCYGVRKISAITSPERAALGLPTAQRLAMYGPKYGREVPQIINDFKGKKQSAAGITRVAYDALNQHPPPFQ